MDELTRKILRQLLSDGQGADIPSNMAPQRLPREPERP